MASPNNKVVFDVGGRTFSTTLQTLGRYPNSLLSSLCEACDDAVGTGKAILIDRNPEGFEWILDLYRGSGKRTFPSKWSVDDVQDELDFYQLPPGAELTSVRADVFLRMENAALKKLAGEMCKELHAHRERIFSMRSADFLACRVVNHRTRFRIHYVDEFVATNKKVAEDFIRKQMPWRIFGFVRTRLMSLKAEHITALSAAMLDAGFTVSKVDALCTNSWSVLKVSWG